MLEETGSAAAMGTILVCSTVPELLFLLLGGVAVDRFSRLWLMLASDLLRGALSLLIALLAWRDSLALWHLFVIAVLFGLARAIFAPAFTAAGLTTDRFGAAPVFLLGGLLSAAIVAFGLLHPAVRNLD